MSAAHIVLTGIGSKLEGLRWESTDSFRIGRQATADVVLRDHSVDRLHAEIKHGGHRWILRDLAASDLFPTLVNGEDLRGGQRELRPHDVLQIGELRIQVTALQNAAPPDEDLSHPQRPGATPLLPTIRCGDFSTEMQIQSVAQHSWARAIELAAAGLPPRQGKALVKLLRANQHLGHCTKLDDLLQAILAEGLPALHAQRAAVLLADPQTQRLEVRAMLAPRVVNRGRSHSSTLAERCFQVGQSLLCQDVHTDLAMLTARSVPLDGMASVLCVLLRTPRQRLGVMHFDRGPLQEPFTDHDLLQADAMAASVSVGIECAQLMERQQLELSQTVATLARALEARDWYCGARTKRVADYALILAEELKLPQVARQQLQAAAPLYDIGTIGIDDAILRKPGRLSPAEFDAMKEHTLKGAALLEGITALKAIVPIVRHHHERWDGSGYPDGLGQEQIALSARIMAVADSFGAMTSPRPYRPAMPSQLAFQEILSKAGTHFDPACVHAFLRVHGKIEQRLKG